MWVRLCPQPGLGDRQGLFSFPTKPRVHMHAGLSRFRRRRAVLLSGMRDPVASALPLVCVIAVSAVVVVGIVAWLVREVALRAIEKSEPTQVAAVVLALAALVSPFRWIWPWSSRRS